MHRISFFIVLGVMAVVGLVYFTLSSESIVGPHPDAVDVEILQKWDLPILLEEISGIDFIDAQRIAAVQDEEGIIFIYDLENSNIEKQIPFGENGDYEGLAIAGSTAWVLRSDGILFEVQNYLDQGLITTEHDLGLKPAYDTEGLTYDKANNRLLITIKDKAGDEFKPVFAFDLSSQLLEQEPAYKLFFDDPVFEPLEEKGTHRVIRPSEIKIHPETGNIYLLEGTIPKLLILNSLGDILQLYILKSEQFSQAEGMAFNKEGELYISNESKNQPPNILKIKLPQ